MKITNIEIRDFRNITNVNTKFGKINIITGNNSSGKTNFLLALSNALSLEKNYSDIFKENIVTYAPGKDKAVFNVSIGDTKGAYAYVQDDNAIYIAPEEFQFKKIIEKRTSSIKSIELFFTGNFSKKDSIINKNNPDHFFKQLSDNSERLINKLVYRESVSIALQDNENKVINSGKEKLENQEKFYEIFSRYSQKVKCWMESTNTSSNLIYDFVVKRPTAEEYEQVIEYFKKSADPKRGYSPLSFKNAKFIYLLADIQKNSKIRNEFKKDITLYTGGIVNDIHINLIGKVGNKGEIMVSSPQGPKDLFTISTGTAVMLYFVTLKNWLNLGAFATKYEKPDVMIFDELETNLHPTLLPSFHELLRAISNKTQLFIATHSPLFIDYFEKKEIFLMKDTPSLPGKVCRMNRCNMLDYEAIIRKLPAENQDIYLKKSNSDLFINGTLDLIYPSYE